MQIWHHLFVFVNKPLAKQNHTLEGVGVVPGRVLLRQVYNEHQEREMQRDIREKKALVERKHIRNSDSTKVSWNPRWFTRFF